MSGINIGKTILALRKENNITQEQLANMIGITPGAVSKWENENSTPDITLLAPLARALNTSIDILLSFQKNISEEEVNNIKKSLTDIFLSKGYIVGEQKCKELLREYPNSIYLKLAIAGLIQVYAMMSENVSEEIMKERLNYSLKLFYDVVESKDVKYTTTALFSVASLEMMLENYDESEKALKELSKVFIDPMVLYVSLLERQGKNIEAEKLCKSMLLQYLNQMSVMLSTLARVSKNEEDLKRSELYLEALNSIQSKFKIGMGSAAYNFAKLYLEKGSKELSAKWFKNYTEELIDTPYDYSENQYFEGLILEVGIEGQKVIRKKLLTSIIESDEFKELDEISIYQDAKEGLKCAIEAL